MLSLRALKKATKDAESKKKKRKGSGEGYRRGSGCMDDTGGEMIHGEESVFAQALEVKMPSPEDLELGMEMDRGSGGSGPVNADRNRGAGGVTSTRVMQNEATFVHAQANKRKASSSPEKKCGVNKGKKMKIGTELEGKKVKIGTEVEGKTAEKGMEESVVGGSEGSSSIGAGPEEVLNERGGALIARRVERRTMDNQKSEGSGSNGSGSPAGVGVAPTVPRVAVAVTPHMPRRYGYLLKLITFLLPNTTQGRAYERSFHKIEALLRHSGCSLCLFFEWEPSDKKTLCWMFNTLTRTRVQFLVNPAFTSKALEVKVKRGACSFSSNFGSDETWNAVKEMLQMMFCPDQHEQPEQPDHLYVFTRIDDCVYFRNMEIGQIPTVAGDNNDAWVLNEVGPYFCLKLIDVQRESATLCRASDISQSQMTPELSLYPVMSYNMLHGLGPSMLHSLSLNGKEYLIVLENGLDLSVYEGFNISLLELLDEESFLKKKKIVGSKDDEEHNFVRNIGKLIIRSIFDRMVELFSSDKCVDVLATFDSTNILLKGSTVKFFGLELVKYEADQAKGNVVHVVQLILGCFPRRMIPCDLLDMFAQLFEDLEDPLDSLKLAKDDPSLLLAKEKRALMIHLHTEYMTNVKPKLLSGKDNGAARNSFFQECPYLDSWINTMGKNKYLGAVANYNSEFVTLRVEKKTVEIGKEGEMAELQFSIMRNCDVHIPENAVKDGITPFRLSWTDYIRSCYFPRYLSFIRRGMVRFKSQVA